jgi:ferredoxin
VGHSMTPDPVFEIQLLLPDGERAIHASGEQHIWDAALEQGVTLPALCHQGRCLTCAARLENGGVVDQSDSVTYFDADRRAGFVLLCTGKPRSNLRIRTHQAEGMREFRRGQKLPAPYS